MEDTDMSDWRKSTYSNGGGNACVETASGNGVVLVRDTTNRDGSTLALSANVWQAFTSKIKSALRETPSRADPSGGRHLCVSGHKRPCTSPSARAPMWRASPRAWTWSTPAWCR
jgi:hypothetical protein